jgi:hypothetical protein
MKKIFFLGALAFSISNLSAQIEGSSFTSTGHAGATSFATDYQAVGINPANLGWTMKFEDKKIALGLNEFTFSIHSQALEKQELRDEFSSIWRNKSVDSLTRDEKLEYAKDFTDLGFAMNANFGSFGFALTTDKLGGIGFRINDHFSYYSRLGETASDLLFLGKTSSYFDSLTIVNYNGDTTQIANDPSSYDYDTLNILSGFTSTPDLISEITKGTDINSVWYREYNLSYGRKIIDVEDKFAIYAGAGVKYLQGMFLLNIVSDDDGFTAYSATTPFFDIDYGNAAMGNPSAMNTQSGSIPNAVGSGVGFDLGFNAVIGKKLKIATSIIDMGSMTWDGNVYTVKDDSLFNTESNGLEGFNIAQSFSSWVGDDGIFSYQGEEKIEVKLPTKFRFGASLDLGEIAEIGFDYMQPMNDAPGNMEKPMFGVGGDIKPLPFLKISAGVLTGGNYDTQVPVGIGIFAPSGTYEFGIASRDAVTFFAKNGPTLSLSMGFMRFRF